MAALAGGSTVQEASAAAGVAESTAYRRLRDADFKRQVSDARTEMVAQTVGKLAEASTRAARKLEDLLDAESESVALGAARSILELGSRLRESTELARRIAELEARAAGAPTIPLKGRTAR
jgi:hypothetical protein